MKRSDINLLVQPNNYDCNATSLAMLLGHKNTDMVGKLYSSLETYGSPGCPYNLNAELTHHLRGIASVSLNINASLADLDAALDSGKACMTHGYFTPSGHIFVIVGRDGTGYKSLDPFSEFNAGTWNYDLGSYGFKGIYSRQLVWATCVTSDSESEAYSAYDSGWDWSDNNEKGMWLHTVDYVNDDEPMKFSPNNYVPERV